MPQFIWILLVFMAGTACSQTEQQATQATSEPQMVQEQTPEPPRFNPEGKTLATRFSPPEGFVRVEADSGSFGAYLRHLPLKKDGALVSYFDGRKKPASGVYKAVVDMDISSRDLQQCADAVMRLRGEYLYHQKRYRDIHFNFLSDGKPRYYVDRADGTKSYRSFLKYMDYIFAFANTASLKKELNKVSFEEIQPGDVFIVQGNPFGHAVIVTDVARHPDTGEKAFMLAQSYMPAQETQVLFNPLDRDGGVWYFSSRISGDLRTPEWRFTTEDLHRFPGE